MTGPRCDCCYDVEFDDRSARRELADDRRRGPRPATRALAEALAQGDAHGLSVLDIGAGIGTVHRLLLEAGAAEAIDVDASGPYLAAAEAEAKRLGFEDRTRFIHGDFVALAANVPVVDVVALDRVACCYFDGPALIAAAAGHARRRLGVVIPPDGLLARLAVRAINAWQWIIRSRLRMQAHRHADLAAAAARQGLRWTRTERIGVWRLLLFERAGSPPGAGAQAGG
jgi:SAM-dependent methyltransferase